MLELIPSFYFLVRIVIFRAGGAVGFYQNHRYRKKKMLNVCYVPTTNTTFLAFFLLPLTVLMKQTRQAVCGIKQSILLRCL